MSWNLTQQQTDTLTQLIQRLGEAAARALGDTLNVSATTDTPELVFNDTWADVPDRLEGFDPLMVCLSTNEPFASKLMVLLKGEQAQVMADLMLGGPGAPAETSTPSDMQLSAIGEAMNQAFNQGLMALSTALLEPVTARSAEVFLFTEDERLEQFPDWGNQSVLSVHGRWSLTVEEQAEALEYVLVLPQTLTQLWLEYTAKPNNQSAEPSASSSSSATEGSAPLAAGGLEQLASSLSSAMPANPQNVPQGVSATATAAWAGPQTGGGQPGVAQALGGTVATMVQPLQFGSFDQQPSVMGEENRNLQLLLDVQLNLSVELGRTRLPIKDVLELTRGSIIELERVAGEPVDLYANGKLIARGEVVVIEDHFGLRITSIVAPADRIRPV